MNKAAKLIHIETVKQQPVALPKKISNPIDYYIILFICDILSLFISLFFACILRDFLNHIFLSLPKFSIYPEGIKLLFSYWLFLPLLLSLFFHRLYDKRLPFWEEIREVYSALFSGFMFLYALIFLTKHSSEISRLTVGLWLIFSFFFVPAIRYVLKNLLFSFKRYTLNTLIIGSGVIGQSLARTLKEEKYLGYRVVAFLDEKASITRKPKNIKVFYTLECLPRLVRLMQIECIFIAAPNLSLSRLVEVYTLSQRLVKEVFIIPEFYSLGILNADIACFLNQKIFAIRTQNKSFALFNKILKRFLDIILVIVSLPLVLPLLVLISIAIKLDSPGPIFFRHLRLGEKGKVFYLWKFRTMYTDSDKMFENYLKQNPEAASEWYRFRKLRHDPRITRVGRFLRRFSLDELPQIFNILRGEMSWVGPRPITLEEYELYYQEQGAFYFSVKPGLTGLWQVSGRNLLPFEERIHLDVWYVLNWSFWLDFIILIRTVGAVLSAKGSF